MKIDAVPEELKTAIRERKSSKIKKTLSNKSLFLFKNSLIIDDKNHCMTKIRFTKNGRYI